MTTAEFYLDYKTKLKAIYDDHEADNISDWVFENVTGLKKWERRMNKNLELQAAQINLLQKYLQELLQSKPVQYVLNEAWFYKRKFYVNEDVLIPRPETEELVQWIVNEIPSMKGAHPKILDIGTGSGCISISLKKELPEVLVTAIDVSENALVVARKNAAELHSDVNFLKINFLEKQQWDSFSKFNVIVSNPPYIPIIEKEILSKNVTEFEPGIALFVQNNDPFIFYKKIAGFAENHLAEKGKIFVEVHEEYAHEVKNIFENAGFISSVKKDIYGKERMVGAQKITSSHSQMQK
jgi:release factor glutamine methyltransferase